MLRGTLILEVWLLSIFRVMIGNEHRKYFFSVVLFTFQAVRNPQETLSGQQFFLHFLFLYSPAMRRIDFSTHEALFRKQNQIMHHIVLQKEKSSVSLLGRPTKTVSVCASWFPECVSIFRLFQHWLWLWKTQAKTAHWGGRTQVQLRANVKSALRTKMIVSQLCRLCNQQPTVLRLPCLMCWFFPRNLTLVNSHVFAAKTNDDWTVRNRSSRSSTWHPNIHHGNACSRTFPILLLRLPRGL